MTTSQEIRIRAFEAQLLFRGSNLLTDSNPPLDFKAVIAFSPQELDEFELGPAQRTDAVIYVLRDNPDPLSLRPQPFYSLNIKERTVLTKKEDQNERWTVSMIEDNPVNVLVMLHCNRNP